MILLFLLVSAAFTSAQDTQHWVNFRVDDLLSKRQRSDVETAVLLFFADLRPQVYPSRVQFGYLELSATVSGSTTNPIVTDIGVVIDAQDVSTPNQATASAAAASLRNAINGGTGSALLHPGLHSAVHPASFSSVPAFSGSGTWSALQNIAVPSSSKSSGGSITSIQVAIIVLAIILFFLVLGLVVIVVCFLSARSKDKTTTALLPLSRAPPSRGTIVTPTYSAAASPTQSGVWPTQAKAEPPLIRSPTPTPQPQRLSPGALHPASALPHVAATPAPQPTTPHAATGSAAAPPPPSTPPGAYATPGSDRPADTAARPNHPTATAPAGAPAAHTAAAEAPPSAAKPAHAQAGAPAAAADVAASAATVATAAPAVGVSDPPPPSSNTHTYTDTSAATAAAVDAPMDTARYNHLCAARVVGAGTYDDAVERCVPANVFVLSSIAAAAVEPAASRRGTAAVASQTLAAAASAAEDVSIFAQWVDGAVGASGPDGRSAVGGGDASGDTAVAFVRALRDVPVPTFSELMIAASAYMPRVASARAGGAAASGGSAIGARVPLIASTRPYPVGQAISFEPSASHTAIVVAVAGGAPGGAAAVKVAATVSVVESLLVDNGWERGRVHLLTDYAAVDAGAYAAGSAAAGAGPTTYASRSNILRALDSAVASATSDSTLFVILIGAGSAVRRSTEADDGEGVLRGFVPADFPHAAPITDRDVLQRLVRLPQTARVAMIVDTANLRVPPVVLPYRIAATADRCPALETATDAVVEVNEGWNTRTFAEAAAAARAS